MTQDFAKRHTTNTSNPSSIPGWVWFLTGLVAGIFLSFLGYLWKFVPPDGTVVDIKEMPRAEPNKAVEEMQFDFYDLFPRSEVPIVEEYNQDGLLVESPNPFAYLLQAGSFQDPNDADQLRASLILQGLEVFVKKIDVNGTTWHRVMVGPFDTDLGLNRAQDKLAEAQIESIPIKVTQ
jgi:cell division protein FtsN